MTILNELLSTINYLIFLAEGDSDTTGSSLSGASWVAKFRGSRDINDLEPAFRTQVQQFISALKAAGVAVSISSTYRPPERAYMMHWSWRIAKEDYHPQQIPAMAGVNINWWHGDVAQSKKAAQEMVNKFGTNKLKVYPALISNHTKRKAIDMNISWTGDLKIKQANSSEKIITSTPKDATNAELIEVGKTYGVIHFIKVKKDETHWSTDGR